jgi:hypothetical protein
VQPLAVHAAAVTSADQGAGAISTALPSSHNNSVSGTSSSSAAVTRSNNNSSSSSSETERSTKRQRCRDNTDVTTTATTTATAGTAAGLDSLKNPMISSTAAEDAVTVQLLHPDSSCSSGNTATAATVGVTVIPGNSSNGNNSSNGSSSSCSSNANAQAAALLKTALYELDMVTLMGCPATRATANQVRLPDNSS